MNEKCMKAGQVHPVLYIQSLNRNEKLVMGPLLRVKKTCDAGGPDE